MSNLLNYERGETLATGFVRPKVTSLFFDKIWLPEEVLDSSFEFKGIPQEVLILQNKHKKTNDIYKKKLELSYRNACVANHRLCENEDIFELIKSSKKEKFTDGDIYLIGIHSNAGKIITPENFDKVKFKYSHNRNRAILLNAENFNREYKMHISPIFHDLTEFEKQTQCLSLKNLYGNTTLKYKLKKPNSYANKNVLSVCIQDFPSIKEEELSWEHVLYIRKDKKSIEKLKRFTGWANRNFSGCSTEQIRESLELELDAYKTVLKEHGIKTIVGSFTSIVSCSSSIASLISQPNEFLFPLLSLTSVSLNFTTNTYFSYLKSKKAPIAYLYDIVNDNI